jgi:predicted lactoylglutathione lyase
MASNSTRKMYVNLAVQEVNRAIQAGSRPTMDAMDRGFLYGWGFYDLDGHQWDLLWMKPAGTVM